MPTDLRHSVPVASNLGEREPKIVVGVTSPQTCLVLAGRLRGLREAGFRVTLLSAPGELLNATAVREAVEAIAVPMERAIAPIADLVSLFGLAGVLRRVRPDLVEFSTPKAGLLGSLAAWICGVPLRVYLLRGLKLETSSGVKRAILLAAERIAAACAHVVVCNSESLRAEALALRVAAAAKLKVLGDGSSHGVDVERFAPGTSEVRGKLGIPAGAPVVGFVGRLTRDKGLPELIDAFDAILRAEAETHLLLVGWFDEAEDALEEPLRMRILAHPRIHCTGMVAKVPPYYRAMDILVLPTWREGFPNVALEAAASELPVVTTLSTGSRDAVVPEVTGLLVPPGYPDAICEAVLKLIHDPERRRAMGLAGRAWVMEHYLDEHVLERTVAFYRALLGLRARSTATVPGA